MLWQSIANLTKYDYLKERVEIGYEFLRRNDLAELPEGLVELEQGDILREPKAPQAVLPGWHLPENC